MLDGVPTMPDILAYDRPNMKMRSAASPIALFAVDPKKRLKIVAIQISNKPGNISASSLTRTILSINFKIM